MPTSQPPDRPPSGRDRATDPSGAVGVRTGSAEVGEQGGARVRTPRPGRSDSGTPIGATAAGPAAPATPAAPPPSAGGPPERRWRPWAAEGDGPAETGATAPASPTSGSSGAGWRGAGRPSLVWLLVVVLASGLVGGGLGAVLSNRSRAGTTAFRPVVTQVVASGGSSLDRVQAVANAMLPVVVQIETRAASGRATGSGVIMTGDGYVLTNAHVVAGAERILVTLPTAEGLRARLIGRDPGSDLAVVKVQRSGLPVANFGSSARLRVGELAIAVGSPFGLQGSVTTGIVSALHRVVNLPGSGGTRDLVNAIQTDAAINPGNSGGALANVNGQVVGINTAIATNGQTEANAGVGFAIPIDEALDVARQLIAGRKVRVPFLGVQAVADLSPEVAEQYKLGGRAGALVQSVLAGGPAAKAGLRGGDLVVRVAGTPVRGWDELKVAVRQVRVGQTIPIVVVRQGRELTLSITPIDQATAG
ncbi:MAG TPA: trypsin-like peptidase domain-containing protein [Actinomycetota bacterium]|nr:trypsin-like peptidase domain-containing protein [Actinomycetota bacterium]